VLEKLFANLVLFIFISNTVFFARNLKIILITSFNF